MGKWTIECVSECECRKQKEKKNEEKKTFVKLEQISYAQIVWENREIFVAATKNM